MSQDMPPRHGDLPAATGPAHFEREEPVRPGQIASSADSAPSPADRPSTVPPSGQAPFAGQAWSQDTSPDTGPVRVPPSNAGQAWWEPRPSGAWSTPGWGASTGRPNTGPTGAGAHGTQSFPGPAPAGYPAPGYLGSGYGGATATRPPAQATLPPSGSKGRRTPVVVATAVALALVAGFGGGMLGAQLNSGSAASSADSSLSRLNTSAPVSDTRAAAPAGSVQDVAAKVLPSTVSVLAGSQQSSGEGSGVILTADGLILTNNHVVEGATTLEVRFNDGTTATAEVVGKTASDDLA